MNLHCSRTPLKKRKGDLGWGMPSYGDPKPCPIRQMDASTPYSQMMQIALRYRMDARRLETQMLIYKTALDQIRMLPYADLKTAPALAENAILNAILAVSQEEEQQDEPIGSEEPEDAAPAS